MLVLSRKTGEKIVLPECDVTITIVEVAGGRVRLGISAPAAVAVYRQEKRPRPRTGERPAAEDTCNGH